MGQTMSMKSFPHYQLPVHGRRQGAPLAAYSSPIYKEDTVLLV